MKPFALALENLVDALETANDAAGFRAAADRLTGRLGFRWFAYLGFSEPRLKVLSTYPASWARRYLEQGYERIDPVISKARSTQRAFPWSRQSMRLSTCLQQRFFSEAAEFRIHNGITVPIRGGFGRLAVFTLAGDTDADRNHHQPDFMDFLQLAALYYHAHVYAKLQLGLPRLVDAPLTPRERQCLVWAARGKKMPEIAGILDISSRTVAFHLENARSKLNASTVAQAVAEALQRGAIES